jgi:hypothetical protein
MTRREGIDNVIEAWNPSDLSDPALSLGRVLELGIGTGDPLRWWGRRAWTIS